MYVLLSILSQTNNHHTFIANSKPKRDVAFNRLPDLVKQWDSTQQDNINKFQQ